LGFPYEWHEKKSNLHLVLLFKEPHKMNLYTSFTIKLSPKIRHNSWSCPDISSAWTSSFAMLFNYFLCQIQFVTTATKYLHLFSLFLLFYFYFFVFYISDHHGFCVRCCTGTRDEYGQLCVGQLQELRTLAWRVLPLVSTSHLTVSSFSADKKLRRRQCISPADKQCTCSTLLAWSISHQFHRWSVHYIL
jgi:hypothetical protein